VAHSRLQYHEQSSGLLWVTISRAQKWLTLSYNLTSTAVAHSELQTHEDSSGSLWTTISRSQQWLTLSYNLTSTAIAHWVTISRAQQWLILSYNLTKTTVAHSELQSHAHSSGSLWVTISRVSYLCVEWLERNYYMLHTWAVRSMCVFIWTPICDQITLHFFMDLDSYVFRPCQAILQLCASAHK